MPSGVTGRDVIGEAKLVRGFGVYRQDVPGISPVENYRNCGFIDIVELL